MIPVLELLLDLDDKLNKISNLENQFIPVETKISFLNNAQMKLVLKKLNFNNNYKLGFDSFSKRYEDLQVLMVPYTELPVAPVAEDVFNAYQSDITTLSQNMVVPIDLFVLAAKNGFTKRRLQVTDIVRHGDLQLKLDSPFFMPSFEYQETLAVMSGNMVYVYPDKENSFLITNLYFSYLRYPVAIDFAGYLHLDGTPSTSVDCELDYYLKNELVDLALQDLAMATGNQEQVQYAAKKTSENE